MHYEGMIIRPPSEANSILLQVTLGCSHNKCTFCGTYREKRFNIKKDDVIFSDIEFARAHCRRQNRLFLCDGDALILPMKRLVPILERIRDRLPWVERVGVYANTKSIRMKTDEELALLHNLGLKIAYMGLESGDNKVLEAIRKGADADKMIAMGKKLKKAGIKVSVTVLLGLGGRKGSLDHARETGRVLTAMDPDFVGALSLMLIPGTELHDQYVKGDFQLLGPDEMLTELGAMISATNLTDGLFHANHASNYLPIRAHLPRDKEKTLELISRALDGKVALKPEYMRAL
ncbi:MAG: radical SAM protein [Desulfobacter postgatei]|uniref:Fe-S oxidoreductase n=1 Tax=Desulfobacter postgatei 2ac9 TaxID=879212 RepID=I5B3Q8_9BACT|nr:radical SAM protein [Desulfobacter postgatei]EIM64121.1 Fe-S oxidoreductase [Desulfobacter postgatei 2ac9]MDD4272848.1 radical SAM protein [Desulfobacter postgatei]